MAFNLIKDATSASVLVPAVVQAGVNQLEQFTVVATSPTNTSARVVLDLSSDGSNWTTIKVWDISSNTYYTDSFSYQVPSGSFIRATAPSIGFDTTVNLTSTVTPNSSGLLGNQINTAFGLVFGDSRARRAITNNAGSYTTIASYDPVSYAKSLSNGKLRFYAISGNSGADINEAISYLDSYPPVNSKESTSTGTNTASNTKYGMQNVDYSQATWAYIHLGINHFSDFDFTSSTLAAREATNSVIRARIVEYAKQLLTRLQNLPIVIWQSEGAVGPAVVNFNGGDTFERGYIWHEKWFNQMLNSLSAQFPNLQILDVTNILTDPANTQYITKQYYTLSSDGSQANQDMHETHWAYRLIGQRLWQMLDPFVNKSVPMGISIAKSDKIGVDKSSYNVYPDSLLYGSTVAARTLYGGGNSTTPPATTNTTGVMYPEMSVQANITAGQANIVCKVIPCPSGFGNAIQADITALVDLDASFGFSLYNVGVSINAAISSGYLAFNEPKVIQAAAYFKAGLAGTNDGDVTDTTAFRQYGFNLRVRTTSNSWFSTATTYGASNSSTDFSTQVTGLQQPGSFAGVVTTPCIKIDGVLPLTPNQMQTRTMASPNTSEYMYVYAVNKIATGQTMRVIIGNVTISVAPLRGDGLIVDII